jgi:hypothetical protein
VRFAIDHDGHHVGVLRILGRHHAGLGLCALDHGAGHDVRRIEVCLSGRIAAVKDMICVGRFDRVLGVASPCRRFDEVFIDAACAGHVDEDHLIVELRPIVGEAVLADLAHVVGGTLAAHLAACRDAVTHLVDLDLVGEEAKAFFLALEALIAIGRTVAELHRQVEADLVACFRLEVGQTLDRIFIGRADKLTVPIAFLGDVDEERARPLFLRFRIAKGNHSLGHE